MLLFSCNEAPKKIEQIEKRSSMAKRIQIDELKGEIQKLKNGQTEFDFVGITSNGIDCIYFIYENNKFNIEFEAISENQIAFIDKIKEFADSNEFKTKFTTYNNKPHYKSDKPAPVLKIEIAAELDKIIEIGQNIQSQIFKNNKETIYDVVP